MMIGLSEYAVLWGINPRSARERAAKGHFETAQKVAGRWLIDDKEIPVDLRCRNDKKYK